MGEMRNGYKIFVGEPERKALGRYRRSGKIILEWIIGK
jgi:hypothetical protein